MVVAKAGEGGERVVGAMALTRAGFPGIDPLEQNLICHPTLKVFGLGWGAMGSSAVRG